jgi:hydrogenase maturation protease
VIGVGNATRGDDAAGLLAARAVGGIELEGDPSALLDLFDGLDAAVVVDAVRSGAPAGTVHRFDAAGGPLPATLHSSTSTHLVGIADAIELARALGRLPPRLTVYAIEADRFDLGAPVTPAVAAAVERVVADLS